MAKPCSGQAVSGKRSQSAVRQDMRVASRLAIHSRNAARPYLAMLPDMKIQAVLSGTTALSYWRRVSSRGAFGSLTGSVPLAPEDTLADALPRRMGRPRVEPPSAKVIDRLRALGIAGEETIHLLVCQREDRRLIEGVACHVCSLPLPRQSLHPVVMRGRPAEGLYVCCPELALMQVAGGMDHCELLLTCFEACGSYRMQPDDEFSSRCPHLCTPSSLASYVSRAKGLCGRKTMKGVLPLVLQGSASPAESRIALALALPWRLGGSNLGVPKLNQEIALNREAEILHGRDSITPDFLFVGSSGKVKLAVEYDSKKYHSAVEQAEYDEKRRNTYAAMGMHCVVLKPWHLKDMRRFDAVVKSMARILGRRAQHLPADYDNRRWGLLCELLEPWQRGGWELLALSF